MTMFNFLVHKQLLLLTTFFTCLFFLGLQKSAVDPSFQNPTEAKEKNLQFQEKLLDSYYTETWFDDWFARYSSTGLGIDRWTNYFYPYDRHFNKFRGRQLAMLEIGVQSGGSTIMWRDYFGDGLDYYGMDIDPTSKKFAKEKVTILIGDQANEADLIRMMENVPDLDIIIDDGGHTMKQQMTSFRVLFSRLKNGGIYLIEDVHTSYLPHYGGSSKLRNLKTNSSMIEMSKSWIDILHLDQIQNPPQNPEWQRLHKEIGGVMFYNNMIFVEKTQVRQNKMIRKGSQWVSCKHCDPGATKLR